MSFYVTDKDGKLVKVAGNYLRSPDKELSTTSTNVVQNDVITKALNNKLSITGNAASATKATQDGDGKIIKDTYTKLDGSNYHAKLTEPSGNGNAAGWRRVASYTVGKWAYGHLSLVIKSRHSGVGLLTIGICDTNGSIETVDGSIRFYGSTDSTMYTNAWKMIYNTTTGVTNLYWRFSDYNSCEVKVLGLNGFTCYWNNGEWLTTEPVAGDNEIQYLPVIYNQQYLPITGGTMNGNIDMSNYSIQKVNHITIADYGVNEGIEWLQGNGWKIYEADDALGNNKGNLQFVTGSTRRVTVTTSGGVNTTGTVVANGAVGVKTTSAAYTDALTAQNKKAMYWYDKNNTVYAAIDCDMTADDSNGKRLHRIYFNILGKTGAWANSGGTFGISIDSDGVIKNTARTPANTANDTQIATTAWVKARKVNIYQHTINLRNDNYRVFFTIINTSATAFTIQTLKDYLYDKGFRGTNLNNSTDVTSTYYPASGNTTGGGAGFDGISSNNTKYTKDSNGNVTDASFRVVYHFYNQNGSTNAFTPNSIKDVVITLSPTIVT